MDFKNVLIFHKKGYNSGKVVLPKEAVKGITTKIEKDYSTNQEKETVILHIDVPVALALGVDPHQINLGQKVVGIEVVEEFKVALMMLQDTPAFNALFGGSK